jgi:hypothetical protein
MEQIKDNGVVYTQNAELPIEERVFFKEAIGMGVNDGRFRQATEAELEAKAEYDKRMAEELTQYNEV